MHAQNSRQVYPIYRFHHRLCGTPSTLCDTPSTLCDTPSTLCGTPSTLCCGGCWGSGSLPWVLRGIPGQQGLFLGVVRRGARAPPRERGRRWTKANFGWETHDSNFMKNSHQHKSHAPVDLGPSGGKGTSTALTSTHTPSFIFTILEDQISSQPSLTAT